MEHLVFLSDVAPFGAAGLVAWMWFVERRASADRERQLTDAHTRILEQRTELDALVALVRENTRAVSALESSQRQLAVSFRAMLRSDSVPRTPPAG